MAEVTRAAAGLHSLSSKKPPSFSSNSFTISSSSSSSKHIYDDVFASTPPNKLKSSQFSSVGDDDYGEIFGSSKSENGLWQSSTSTIPILNLPDSEHKGRNSKGRVEGGNGGGDFDYLGVFGDVGDDSFAFPNGEEVFKQLKKKAKTSESASMPRSKEQTREPTKLHIVRQSENVQRPTREYSQAFDSVKHFQRHDETIPNEPNGATLVAHIHAIPASTSPSHEVSPSQKAQTSRTPMIKEDTEVKMGSYLAKEGKHCGNTSSKLGAHEQKGEDDMGFMRPTCLSASISMATSYESHQASSVAGPSKVLKGEAKVQFDVKDDLSAAIPGSTSLHEVDSSQKIQTNRAEHGIGIIQENKKAELSSKTSSELEKGEVSGKTSSELSAKEWGGQHDTGPQKASGLSESNSVAASHDTCQASTIVGPSTVVKDDTKLDFHVKYTNTDARPSDLVPNKQNGENDAVFQKASGLNGSNQNDISHDSCPANYAVGSSKGVQDDSNVAMGFDVGKKQVRHARMTSLDLRDHKQACQSDAASQRKSRFGSSHSFDAAHDPFAARIKVQPSKVVPSSSLPQFFPVANHCKISENSSDKNLENNLYKGAGGSPPSLDEQLDVNSVAAKSAAALQKAIEEAEMRIRLAKEFLEREGQGNVKLSFKDTLKRKVGKENSNANERSEYQHTNVQHRPQVESTMQNHSYIDRKNVLQTTQVASLFEGQKKSPKDEERMERKNANVSKLTEVGDKHEGGGEWEAAKHLNQLISGVKNRIASFMTWQAETEKKEEPKETEASRKSQSEQKLKDADFFEMKETEINQSDSVLCYETKEGGSKTELIPEVIEPDKNELMQSHTVMQEKAGHNVDVVPHNEGPTRSNFLFFTFSSERSWGHAHPEGGEKKKPEGSGELGVENRQKDEIDEVKDEQIQDKTENANQEGLDKHCSSQDSRKSLQSSSNSEGDGIVEEPYAVTGYDRSEFTCEEDSEKRLNDDRGDDKSEFTHADNHDITLSEECEEDRSKFNYQRNGKPSEECGEYISKCTYQEKEMLNDEHEENKSECDYEKEGSMNEVCKDDSNRFTHHENRRLSEECRDNNNESGHEEDMMLSEENGVDETYTTHEENNDIIPSERGGYQSDFTREGTNNGRMNLDCGEEPINSNNFPEPIIMVIETESEREEYGEVEEAEDQLDNRELLDEVDLVGEIGKRAETVEVAFRWQKNESDQEPINDSEGVAQQMDGWEENKKDQSQSIHAEETENIVTDQVDCTEDECKQTENKASDKVNCVSSGDESYQTENEFLSKVEETCDMDGSNSEVEDTVISDEEIERMVEINNSSSEPEINSEIAVSDEESEKMMETNHPSSKPKKDAEIPAFAQVSSKFIEEERVLLSSANKDTAEFRGIVHLDGTDAAVPCENFVSHTAEFPANELMQQKDIDGKVVESNSEEIWENQTEYLNKSALDLGKAPNVGDHVQEKSSFEAVHRRRRWFENSEKAGNADRPSILEVEGTNLEIDEDPLEESNLPGSVKIHGIKLEAETSKVTTGTGSGSTLNRKENGANVEVTPKRRRWFVNRGGEGILEPRSLFSGIKVTSEMDPEIVNELESRILAHDFVDHMHTESGNTLNVAEGVVVVNEDKSKQNAEATPRRKRWFESGDKVGSYQQPRREEDAKTNVDINQEHEEMEGSEKSGEEKDYINSKTEPVFEVHRDLNAVNRKKKEKEKEKMAVERAIREARERAFVEARKRARRDAVERPTMEGSQKVGSGAQDRPAKASSEATSASDKASMEAKHRAERAAVERATAEARERALQKALSEKASHRLREPTGRHQPERNSSFDPKYHSSSSYTRCSDPSNKCEKIDGGDGESAQRCKARLERQKRTMERAAKALEEKNTRDLQAQKEQAAKNMFADTLDAEVKRWSSGKEGNLRALLSTLQYILGSESGWQAISLTDLVAPTAVRKAYKKATLCVHPDKLQQRGATIQQKYICEKIFDLLKEAWSKFNPDDR